MSENGSVGFSVIYTMGFAETIASMEKATRLFAQSKNDIEHCAGHLRATWEGAGGTQFTKYFDKIRQALTDDVEILTGLTQRLSEIKKAYDSVDQQSIFTVNDSTNTYTI